MILKKINKNSHQIKLTVEENRRLSLPTIIVSLALEIILVIYGLVGELPLISKFANISVGLLGMIYTSLTYLVLFPYFCRNEFLRFLFSLFNAIVIGLFFQFQPVLLPGLSYIFFTIFVIATAVHSGRLTSYSFMLIAIIMQPNLWKGLSGALDFDTWAQLFLQPVISVVAIETIISLQKTVLIQMRRLEVVNRVARSLSSTLEINQVTALVASAVQSTLDADTYYLGIVQDDHVHLELLYDDGEFFPPTDLSLKNTLAGWVISHNQSLLIRNLAQVRVMLGITPSTVGKPKLNKSWVGTPLQSGGRVLGLIAAASYQQDAYDRSDMDLLENVAQQAAMAIDNAFHHADVERKSQLDSLTGMLNHGAFLKALGDAAVDAGITDLPLSVIMLDIDKFKHYNDTYGHLIGDQVLSILTETIHSHIKTTDLVGRWGGEEFVIALPNANGAQASQIAQRIQSRLKEMRLEDRNGNTIPAPTISQGIAEFSKEANEIYALIDLADKRLYIAKERGRDQIEPQPDFWLEK